MVRLTTTELARTRCAEPAVTLAFVGTADSTRARLVSLSDKGAAHAWKQRLTLALPLPLPEGHVGTHLAIATRRSGGSLIALASTHATERAVARGIEVMVLANLADRARSTDRAAVLGTALGGARPMDCSIRSDSRSLVIPVPILGLAFCGTHSLCVAHPDEYVLISIGSGCVRELFRFAADYGAPFLRRLSENTLLVLQPPPLCRSEWTRGQALDHSLAPDASRLRRARPCDHQRAAERGGSTPPRGRASAAMAPSGARNRGSGRRQPRAGREPRGCVCDATARVCCHPREQWGWPRRRGDAPIGIAEGNFE